MVDTVRSIIDGIINAMGPLDERVLVLDKGLWNAFAAETGIQPATGSDEAQLPYRGFELRRGAELPISGTDPLQG